MKYVSTSIVAIGLLALTACGEADMPVRGTEWRVESLGTSTQPFADGHATVSFDEEGHIAAYAGCNRMGGSYTVQGRVLNISRLISTRMACFPQQKLLDEQALAEALSKVTKVEVKQGKATLSGADGVAVVLWNLSE